MEQSKSNFWGAYTTGTMLNLSCAYEKALMGSGIPSDVCFADKRDVFSLPDSVDEGGNTNREPNHKEILYYEKKEVGEAIFFSQYGTTFCLIKIDRDVCR